mgnify:CR=1 FL=1
MKRLFLALLIITILAGCVVVPVGSRYRYGVIVDGPPAYNRYPYRYGGYDRGYGRDYGYGWGRPTRWVPGSQRWVCEGPPPNQKCYWTWEPAHYR